VLLGFYALAVTAGFVAPHGPTEQDRRHPFAPPTRVHFFDADGRFHLRPFVHPSEPVPGTFDRYVEDRGRIVPIRFFVPAEGGGRRLFAVEAPARIHLLGTDEFGRDLFSRLLHGARVSLFAGLAAGLLSAGLGLLVGSAAGFYRGWVDELLMRVAELFMVLPWLYLLLAVRAYMPLETSPGQALLLIVGIVGVIGWARPARLIRGVAMTARERDFVLAARGFGAGDLYLLARHVLPQAGAVAVTQLALLVPRYTVAEVALSFLGLGVGEPAPSWGNLLAPLQRYHVLVSYWWMFSPALALVIVILSYHRLADALQSRLGVTT
jgi:peptide/nickel transport system permease protein